MSAERDPATDQPLPVPNDRPHIHDLVQADIAERKALGTAKYGTPLQSGNGRDNLRDAYEEALDLAIYLRAEMDERERAEAKAAAVEALAERWQAEPPTNYKAHACAALVRSALADPAPLLARVRAEALREAADAWGGGPTGVAPMPVWWLRERADRIEAGGTR